MISKEANDLIEKIAAQDDSTGMSQVKRRSKTKTKNYEGEGAGLGALLGAGAGALSKKYKPLAAAAGASLGALAGKYFGKSLKGKSHETVDEGVIKRQEKVKGGGQASVPRLTDEKVLKSIGMKQ